MKRAFTIVWIVLMLASPAAAQDDDANRRPRLYELQARPASEVAQLINGFVPEHLVSYSVPFNTITAIATPAEHEMIERLIRRFDVAPAEIEFQLYVLRASSGGGNGTPREVPDDIAAIVREVKALTRYDRFELLDSPVLRVMEGQGGGNLSGEGAFNYELGIGRTTVRKRDGVQEIGVGRFRIEFNLLTGYMGDHFISLDDITEEQLQAGGLGPIFRAGELQTSFNIDHGEKIVLGASRIQGSERSRDLAIVTVVEARILE